MSAVQVLGDYGLKVAVPMTTFVLGVAVERWGRLSRFVLRKQPLQVHVETDPRVIFANAPNNWVAAPMFVPVLKDSLPESCANSAFAVREWALENHGIPATSHDLQVTLTAWRDLSVVVDSLRIEAKSFAVPDGVIVSAWIGGASIERRRVEVELSTWAPTARYVERGGAGMPNFSFELSGGEVGRLALHVCASQYDGDDVQGYEWTGFLDLLVDNKRRTIVIDDSGKPFKFVKGGARPVYRWGGQNWTQDNDAVT